MQVPLQISFRNMESSPAVESRVREEVDKLAELYERVVGCRVMVEIPHRHHETGKRFRVRVNVTVPGAEIVANNEPSLKATRQETMSGVRQKSEETGAAHKDVYVAIRDAFKAARRQLQEFAREQRGEVKYHEANP